MPIPLEESSENGPRAGVAKKIGKGFFVVCIGEGDVFIDNGAQNRVLLTPFQGSIWKLFRVSLTLPFLQWYSTFARGRVQFVVPLTLPLLNNQIMKN